MGVNTIEFMGEGSHTVKNVYLHPKYMGGHDHHFFNDVALLELNDHIEINQRSTKLVNLAQKNDRPKNGSDAIVSGWGTNPDHPNENRLYQVHLNIISAQTCHDELAGGTVEEIEKHQICAEAPGKNHCEGDSGGPLLDVKTKRQIGIVSYGAQPCTLAKPSIYTRVTDNLDFINKIIRKTGGGNSMMGNILNAMPTRRPLRQ